MSATTCCKCVVGYNTYVSIKGMKVIKLYDKSFMQ